VTTVTDRGEVTVAEFSTSDLEAWVREYAAATGGDEVVRGFARRVDEKIMAAIPEIAADPTLQRDLAESSFSQWDGFLARLPKPYEFELPQPAGNLARSLARRGQDLGILLKVYRTVYPTVFEIFTDVTDRLGDQDPPPDQALKYLWNRAVHWLDDSVEALIATYYEERQMLAEGALIRRSQRINEVLDDPAVDGDAASRDLAHPLTQWQTAIILWDNDAHGKGAQPLLDLAARAAQLLGAPRPLALPVSTHDVWGWIATPTRPDVAALSELAAELDGMAAHLAVGTPQHGVAGFRASHAEASAAQRLCLSASRTPPLVEYSDVELLCLLSLDDQMLARMVEREIGPLLGADKNLAPVRETALVYLTERQNVEATADQLFVHKNTVRYRLARAEELLGRPLTDHAAKVEIALRYVSIFGPPTVDR